MESAKVLLIGAAIIVAGGVGWYAYSAQSGDSMMMKGDDAMMQKEATTTDGAMMKDQATTTEGAMMKKEDGAMMKAEGDVMIKKEGDAMMKDTGTTQ